MTAANMNIKSSAPGAVTDSSARILPADIERVDAIARKQCKRARAAGPELEEVAVTVRNLHTVLKHLKFEVEDAESPLSSVDGSAVYARQLMPILEDSEFTLKQLDTILGKKHEGSDGEGTNGGVQMDGEKGWTILESRERDMIDLISTKLAKQKLNLDMFLDTVQLQNPSKSRRMVDTTSANLDDIKDKVDVIASRICQRNNSNLVDGNEEDLWEQFRDELDRAGFSRDVLRKNQDVIRAYIRQLDEQRSANGGNTPSVRGLLEQHQQQYHPHPRDDHGGLQITPYPTYPTPAAADLSPEDIPSSGIDEEKLFPSSRMKRLQEDDDRRRRSLPLPPPNMPDHPTYLSYDRHSSSGDDDESMALMSTRELMAIDKRSADLALAMGNMHLQPPPDMAGAANNYHMTSSSAPAPHYLPPPSASQPALLTSPQHHAATTATAGDPHASQPRFVPPLLLGNENASPTLRSHSVSGPVVPGQYYQQQQQEQQQRAARLAPDSKGREIPLDAKWTRIPRRLVSPEVLAGAGVRYEARPDFVAVLGELGRDKVAEFARRTAEVRNARRRRSSAANSAAPAVTVANGSGNGTKKERRVEDKYHPNKYRNWDVIDEERRRRHRHKGDGRNGHDTDDDDDDGVTYIVNSPHRRRRGSAASTISELYDSSDERSSESDSDNRDRDRDRERHGSLSYSQSFPRSGSQHLDDYHRSRSQRRRSTTPATSSKYDYDYDDKTRSKAKDRADSDATDGLARDDVDKDKGKGTKVYPVIVSPPSSSKNEKDGSRDKGAGASPAATIKPKPILKNKNDDPHVRIDPTPQIIDEGSSSLPRSLPSYRRSERERERREREKEKDKEKDRERDRDRDRRDKDKDRDHDREKRYRSDRYTDRDRDRHPDRDRDREREREKERDRDGGKTDRYRDKDKEYYSSHRDRDRHRSHSHRYHGGSGGGGNGASSSAARRDRDREYYDDHYTNTSGGTRGKEREKDKEDRSSKKARNETLRAVSLGGAAAAMLSMLSEAAL